MPKFGARRYRLNFDDGRFEYVNASTPSEAVALRSGGRRSLLPHTITDLTALDAWARGQGARAGIHTTPLLDRMYPEGWVVTRE